MPRPESAPAALRWLRALLLATVALLAGSLAHASAGGRLPGAARDGRRCWSSARGRWPRCCARAPPPAGVVLLLVLGQAAVHLLLTAGSGHHEDEPVAVLTGPALWLHHLAEDLTARHAVMALAHAVAAAAVVGLWLARGEHALWLLVDLAGHAFAPLLRWPALPVPARPPRVVPVDGVLLPRHLGPRALACRAPRAARAVSPPDQYRTTRRTTDAKNADHRGHPAGGRPLPHRLLGRQLGRHL